MSMQAQQVQKPVVQKTEQVNMEVNPTQAQEHNVDATTLSVAAVTDNAEANATGTNGNSESEQSSKQQAERIKKAVEKMNKNMSHSEAVFGIHEATNRVTIKIVDKNTKEVIKELPPEKTLDMIARVWELAGILVDEKR